MESSGVQLVSALLFELEVHITTRKDANVSPFCAAVNHSTDIGKKMYRMSLRWQCIRYNLVQLSVRYGLGLPTQDSPGYMAHVEHFIFKNTHCII
jgi:hypothetical protein